MPISSQNQIVQAEVEVEIYEAARARCESRVQNLSAICRAIINRAATTTGDYINDGDKRVRGQRCHNIHRMRFVVDRQQYEIAKKRIRARGSSVGIVLNEGLTTFALTGRID